MSFLPYAPFFELTRGNVVESLHNGAIAVVNVYGELLARFADPEAVTFLRSTAKPFQALPFLEQGGQSTYGLTLREIAILCASHSGTDEHVSIVKSVQSKAGISESELLCGVHIPSDEPTATALRERKEQPTPNRHNCSGKHTGMLAFARMQARIGGEAGDGIPYIDPVHPIQKEILRTVAEMCHLPVDQIALGIDGCSAPNFAIPLKNVAFAYARLCDPESGAVKPEKRANACRTITEAMISNPDMVGGPGRFDTMLMEVGQGRIVSKGGAEAYQGIGLMPGALGSASPAIGIALKIADGDARGKVRAAVTLEVLRQLGALSPAELEALSEFGPRFPVLNWRKIHVGQGYPTFVLERSE
jgi:L-asparaginase II